MREPNHPEIPSTIAIPADYKAFLKWLREASRRLKSAEKIDKKINDFSIEELSQITLDSAATLLLELLREKKLIKKNLSFELEPNETALIADHLLKVARHYVSDLRGQPLLTKIQQEELFAIMVDVIMSHLQIKIEGTRKEVLDALAAERAAGRTRVAKAFIDISLGLEERGEILEALRYFWRALASDSSLLQDNLAHLQRLTEKAKQLPKSKSVNNELREFVAQMDALLKSTTKPHLRVAPRSKEEDEE